MLSCKVQDTYWVCDKGVSRCRIDSVGECSKLLVTPSEIKYSTNSSDKITT